MSEDKELETQTPEIEEDKTSENESENEQDLDPKSLLAQKKHFKEKFEKVQAELESLKSEKQKQTEENKSTPPVDKSASNQTDLETELNTIKFTVANKDLDADDVAEIVDYAKGKGVTLEEAKKSPVIQAYLKTKQDDKSLEDSSPSNYRSPKSKPQKPVEEMTREEHKEWAKQFGVK